MIQVIDRALDILEFVANRENGGLSLKEISEHLSLNQATCANIIKSLTTRKYLEHIGPKKGFRLGPMSVFLLGNFSLRPLLVMAAKDIIDKLSIELNENCLLGVIHHDKRILVYSTTIDHDLSVKNKPERSIYETASGRLLLAFLNDGELATFIERAGLPSEQVWKGAHTREKLLFELHAARKNKIVISRTASHVVGVAVPVWKNEMVVAALSTYLPESRYTGNTEHDIEAKLRFAAGEISERLGKA
jgi:DNA-binding IclR family transcriptional regulator